MLVVFLPTTVLAINDSYTYKKQNLLNEEQKVFAETEKRTMILSDEKTQFDIETFVYANTVYVPLRTVAEVLGKDVLYDKNNDAVYILEKCQKEEFVLQPVSVREGEKSIKVNKTKIYYQDKLVGGSYIYFPQGFLCEGKIYIPLKDITEALGYIRVYEGNNIILDKPSGKVVPLSREEMAYIRDNGEIVGRNGEGISPELIEEAKKIAVGKVIEPDYLLELGSDIIVYQIQEEEAVYISIITTMRAWPTVTKYGPSIFFRIEE